MCRPLQVTAFKGAGNVVTFLTLNKDGTLLTLGDFISPLVTVVVENPLGTNWVITSTTDDVSFTGSVLSVKFGKLDLPEGIYYPEISYTHTTEPDPIVIVGRKHKTEILLTARE